MIALLPEATHADGIGRMTRLLLARDLKVLSPAGVSLDLAPRDAVILAWLLVEGPCERERMASLLWPESSGTAARNALRQRIFKLKKLYELDLVFGRSMLAVGEVAHDLADGLGFLGSGELGLTGELLAWLHRRRQQNQASVHVLLGERAQRAQDAGDFSAALVDAQALLELDIHSEHAHRRVIRLHYLAGDRPLALKAFDRCEQVLKNEVGIAPAAETLELLRVIERAADGSIALAISAGWSGALPAAVLRPPVRVGREQAWRDVCASHQRGSVVLLSGEAGLGKSRLLQDFVEAANRGACTAILVKSRLGDASSAYSVLGRSIRGLLELNPGHRVSPVRRELAWLMREFVGGPTDAAPIDQRQLVSAMKALLDEVAEQCLITVAIDDLQFADDASVEMLRSIVGETQAGWLIAFRPAELSSAATSWFDGLYDRPEVVSHRLRALDAAETAQFLGSLAIGFDVEHQAVPMHRHTGGNPLFILETLKASLAHPQQGAGASLSSESGWPVAPNVSRLIEQRLMRLSALALRVARCAAVAGQDTCAELVADALGKRLLDLADAWLELERAQVFFEGRFAHDLIAEAALASVPTAIATSLHGEVAAWLECREGEPARIAAHWIAAGQPLRAAPRLREAAGAVRALLRFAEAAALFEQAADIWRHAGHRRSAFDGYFAAADAYSEIAFDGRLLGLRDAMADLIDDEDQRQWFGYLELCLLCESRAFTDAFARGADALVYARTVGDPELEGEVLWAMAVLHWELRETSAATAAAERALGLFRTPGLIRRRVPLSGTPRKLVQALGRFLTAAGRYAEADSHYLAVRREALAGDELDRVALLDGQLGMNALDQGSLPGAMECLDRSRGLFQQVPTAVSNIVVGALHSRARIAMAIGDLGLALHSLTQAVAACEMSLVRDVVAASTRLCRLHFMLGRRDLALKGLKALLGRVDLTGGDRLQVEASLIHIGQGQDSSGLLEGAAGLLDFSMRAEILFLAMPRLDPAQALPLLAALQATAREQGGHGVSLLLEVCRSAALRRANRMAEAADAARAACERLEDGICCFVPLPCLVAEVCPALVGDPELAQLIALRAMSWMHSAAASLPAPWRDNFLERAPVFDRIRPALIAPGPHGHLLTSN